MQRRNSRRVRGVTLMEVMMATAILAVVIGITATSLTSFYVTMDIQEQRIESINSCRAVMGSIREKRDEFYDSETDLFDWGQFATWIDANNDNEWQEFLKDETDGSGLESHSIEVQLLDMNGDPAAIGQDNPIEVHVISSWYDRKGHPLEAQVIGVIASR